MIFRRSSAIQSILHNYECSLNRQCGGSYFPFDPLMPEYWLIKEAVTRFNPESLLPYYTSLQTPILAQHKVWLFLTGVKMCMCQQSNFSIKHL